MPDFSKPIEIIQVIVTNLTTRPCENEKGRDKVITQYWSMEGTLLAERDVEDELNRFFDIKLTNKDIKKAIKKLSKGKRGK